MWWSRLTGRLEQAEVLDPAAGAVERAVQAALPRGRVKDLMHGTWLGHPVHPLAVTLPIGLWTGATLLDLSGSDRTAARRLVALGTLSAVPTAATGLADWSELGAFSRPKRVGLVHAALNVVTVGVYAASWLARRRGADGRGAVLALAGLAPLAVSGYLGGHLAYAEAVGANRNADAPLTPDSWTDAAAADDLPEGGLRRVDVDGQAVLLVRHSGALTAMQATCSHYGAPLEQGAVLDRAGGDGAPADGDAPDEACVECPWHGSRFRLSDGAVLRGPATSPQRAFDVREQDGRLQVRLRL